MAKASLDNELFQKLRASGMRKRAARAIAEAGDNSSKLVRGTVDELRGLAEGLENRARGGKKPDRSAAAKKAAGTRKREAAKRSQAAKKGAATRARKAGSSSTSRSSSSRSSSSRSGGSRSRSSSSKS
jgi:hypothetical protein